MKWNGSIMERIHRREIYKYKWDVENSQENKNIRNSKKNVMNAVTLSYIKSLSTTTWVKLAKEIYLSVVWRTWNQISRFFLYSKVLTLAAAAKRAATTSTLFGIFSLLFCSTHSFVVDVSYKKYTFRDPFFSLRRV